MDEQKNQYFELISAISIDMTSGLLYVNIEPIGLKCDKCGFRMQAVR